MGTVNSSAATRARAKHAPGPAARPAARAGKRVGLIFTRWQRCLLSPESGGPRLRRRGAHNPLASHERENHCLSSSHGVANLQDRRPSGRLTFPCARGRQLASEIGAFHIDASIDTVRPPLHARLLY